MKLRALLTGTLIALILSAAQLPAQSNPPSSPTIRLQAPSQFERLFPTHVKANPMGFSPLCRLELDIERKLPLGIWFKMESPQAFRTPASQANLAYFRFKVPLGR